jgi:hypothetical protein
VKSRDSTGQVGGCQASNLSVLTPLRSFHLGFNGTKR